ncbi:MAG: hypothetical protein HY581_07730 [Nitrospirae bacterium]|nr:hypothetical protein [Nitrospirota bacterium]
MDKNDFSKLTASGRFIPGIYNSCDRWCERCPVTSRCLTFAVTNELGAGRDSLDLQNAAFWQHLAETLQMAADLLRKRAEELGLDLDSVTGEELAEEEKRTEEVRNHECCLMAKRYAEIVEEWFDSGMAEGENAGRAGVGLQEALAVIRWYQHQIYIKLLRAIRSDSEDQTEIVDDIPGDAAAQAKIVLIGIDRSIAAWGMVRKCLRAPDDEVLDLMVRLDRLRRSVEKVFPDARALVRPGFEAIDLDSSFAGGG